VKRKEKFREKDFMIVLKEKIREIKLNQKWQLKEKKLQRK